MKRYEKGFRPRCAICDKELDPAPSYRNGEWVNVGFFPCQDHPGKGVIYPEIKIEDNDKSK